MFSDLSEIRAAVRARLEPLMPDGWKFDEYVTEAVQKSLVPAVWLEFIRIESTVDGAPLGPGSAGARFNVIVADPATGTKGEDDVDQHAMRLLGAIEHTTDMYWSGAEKARLTDGRVAWRIDVIALTLTPNPDEPEPAPDPEPDPIPVLEHQE